MNYAYHVFSTLKHVLKFKAMPPWNLEIQPEEKLYRTLNKKEDSVHLHAYSRFNRRSKVQTRVMIRTSAWAYAYKCTVLFHSPLQSRKRADSNSTKIQNDYVFHPNGSESCRAESRPIRDSTWPYVITPSSRSFLRATFHNEFTNTRPIAFRTINRRRSVFQRHETWDTTIWSYEFVDRRTKY